MKKVSFYGVIWLMIVFVLGISIGLPVHIRNCRMPDMPKKVSFFVEIDEEDCCKKHNNTCKIPKEKPLNPCCSFLDDFLQIDFDNFENLSSVELASLNFEFIFISFDFLYQNNYSFLYKERLFFTNSSPPPQSAKDFLRWQKRWNC
ncbi:MAG: hypothetical protein EAZ06_10630 [Cytophagales bacterium]|nr:MAG: hypothetical protein EAZ06_10630 [Cytophagales bacterium]